MGIPVLAPDINTSGMDFTVEDEGIRFGLSAVKNVGSGAVQALLDVRQRLGRFGSLGGICREIDLRLVNKRVLEALVKAGAMDRLGPNRATMHAAIDAAMESGQRALRDRESGQGGLFGGRDDAPEETALRPRPEWADRELLGYEKETLGFYLAGHPLQEYVERIKGLTSHTTATLKETTRTCRVTMAGLVAALKRRRTRKGDDMAVFRLEDLEGSVEAIAFPESYERYRILLENDSAILVTGNLEIADEQRRIIIESVMPLDGAEEKKAREIIITLPAGELEGDAVARVRDLLKERPGPCPVFLEVTRPRAFRATVRASNGLKVAPSRDLTMALEGVLGKGAVRFR
jgi:DNA polymerase-3 subunit alpha